MRTHRAFSYLQFWRDERRLRDLVTGENIVAARLEPIRRHGHDEAVLDITFARGEELAVVPAIVIPTRFVALRESDPLIWPTEVAKALDDAASDAVRDRLLPWLIETLSGQPVNEERFKLFSTVHESAWHEARRLGFLGATPLVNAWPALAPYVYAARFARQRSVVIVSSTAAQGHAALFAAARRLSLPGIDAVVALVATRWFGTSFETVDDTDAELIVADASLRERFERRGTRRVWLGDGPGETLRVARTVPFEVAFAFSEARGEASATIVVQSDDAVAVPDVVAPPASGHDAGRVLLLVRSDALRVPDSDTDEARALATLLGAEGFDVRIASEANPADYDLLHVIGLHEPARAALALAEARRARVPTIVSAQLVDLVREAYWGSQVASACFTLRPDDANVTMLLGLLAGRRLGDGKVTSGEGPPAAYSEAVSQALSLAGSVIVACHGEERLVRDRFGFRGPIEVLPPFVPADAPGPTSHLTGDDEFALVLGPLEPRSNALAALRAADSLGLRLVVAGAVADASYSALLHEFTGDRGIIVEDPGPCEEAALLARTRLYVECGWIPRGPGRLTRAALGGTPAVASLRGWGPELFAPALETADPASIDAITGALRAAWARDRAANPLRVRAEAFAGQRPAFERLLALYASNRPGKGA